MKYVVLLGVIAFLLAPASSQGQVPLKLHPDNPRYFLFRGKPTYLITSGEHYGAIINKDFDYVPYLDELKARGFNQTRAFAGTYLAAITPQRAFRVVLSLWLITLGIQLAWSGVRQW